MRASGRRLPRPKVLVIDEMGYLPFDAVQAILLFQVICRLYQRGQPLILNKAFGESGSVVSDDPVAGLGRMSARP